MFVSIPFSPQRRILNSMYGICSIYLFAVWATKRNRGVIKLHKAWLHKNTTYSIIWFPLFSLINSLLFSKVMLVSRIIIALNILDLDKENVTNRLFEVVSFHFFFFEKKTHTKTDDNWSKKCNTYISIADCN